MKTTTSHAPESRVQKVTYPWLSTLAALLTIAYLLLLTDSGLSGFYEVPASWLQPWVKFAVLGALLVLLAVDLYRYRRQYANQAIDLLRLRYQVKGLWESKKQLQLKAHTYSGHADRLKLFISDKLLEYIEYDEKFLHFKSIAAEVRHNGVISFDKVHTALERAASGQNDDSADYHEALAAMRYLWDLLDLSTADNLALHIGNHLSECEEHYYQRALNEGSDPVPLPFEPVYSPQQAAWRALGLVREESLPIPTDTDEYVLGDERCSVRLAHAGELLGNENHLVLMLENLLRNAQFFSAKRGYKSPFAPIALTLEEHDGQARFRVYNRGPHIRDEDAPNLFQLGFSTRRTREHHGRGLGLYFVNEIVKGYEGRITVHNIHTPETQYTVRIELDNDEVFTQLVDVTVEDGRPRCQTGDDEPSDSLQWHFDDPVRSVEVTATGERDTARILDLDASGRQRHFDPNHPERPRWHVDYLSKRPGYQLTFQPLDITGVEFDVLLPTAQHRLDGSGIEDVDDDLNAEMARLDERFREQASVPVET